MTSISKAFQGPSSQSPTSGTPGTVYAVGNGELYSETGMMYVPELTYPCCIAELDFQPIVDIASGSFHTLALHRNGKLYSWGCNEYGALGRPGEETIPGLIEHVSLTNTKFLKIACGNTMSMAITEENILYTWGTFTSKEGIIGHSSTIKKQEIPRIVTDLAGVDIVGIAAGAAHCLALSSKGHVYSWGSDEYSQLGRREVIIDNENERSIPPAPVNENKRLVPTRVYRLDDIVAIACGGYHSFAVNRYGQMFSWGSNEFQQCGLVREKSLGEKLPGHVIYRPTLMPYFSKADQEYHPGLHASTGGKSSSKRQSIKLIKTKAVEATETTLLQSTAKAEKAITETASKQEVEAKGATQGTLLRKVKVRKSTALTIVNTEKITQATTENVSSIVTTTTSNPIKNGDSYNNGAKIKSVSCGDYHTIVLMSDNRLVVFGKCDGGQLGEMFYTHFPYTGVVTSQDSDTLCALGCPLKNLWHCDYEIKKVVCGANHNIVITQTGEAYGFGHASHSQLGLYTKSTVVAFPTLINSIKNIGKVVNASAGERFSMFIVA